MSTNIMIPVAPGELIDKITILEIKMDRITDPEKLKNVKHELDLLTAVVDAELPKSEELDALHEQLRVINEKIWVTEDELRANWHDDAIFVEASRGSHKENDARGQTKRAINELLGSSIMEEKQHPEYDPNKK